MWALVQAAWSVAPGPSATWHEPDVRGRPRIGGVRHLRDRTEVLTWGSGRGFSLLDPVSGAERVVDRYWGLSAADWDGDGEDEVHVLNVTGPGEYTYEDLETGEPFAFVEPEEACGWLDARADMNGDGRDDLLCGAGAWLASSDGLVGPMLEWGSLGCGYGGFLVDDLDGDGLRDVVLAHAVVTDSYGYSDEFEAAYEIVVTADRRADRWPGRATWSPPANAGCSIASYEADGDGRRELAALCWGGLYGGSHADAFYVLGDVLGSPTVLESVPVTRWDSASETSSIANVGDRDGDGDEELLLHQEEFRWDTEGRRGPELRIVDGDLGDPLAIHEVLAYPGPPGTDRRPTLTWPPVVADVDRDGIPDVLATMTPATRGDGGVGLAIWATGGPPLPPEPEPDPTDATEPPPADPADPPADRIGARRAGCGCATGALRSGGLAALAGLVVGRRRRAHAVAATCP